MNPINSKKIKNYNELKKIISELRFFSISNNLSIFFRGHSKEQWEIKPSLARITNDKESAIKLEFQNIESLLYDNKSSNLLQNNLFFNSINKDWSNLIQLQHLKSNTSLLDWTCSLETSIYFAIKEKSEDDFDACIWILLVDEKFIIKEFNDKFLKISPLNNVKSTIIALGGSVCQDYTKKNRCQKKKYSKWCFFCSTLCKYSYTFRIELRSKFIQVNNP